MRRSESLALAALLAAIVPVAVVVDGPPARAADREVTVAGTGDDGLSFNSHATRRSATRWCLSLTVRRSDEGGVTRTWAGEGYCGTLARESALKIAFACPYGV